MDKDTFKNYAENLVYNARYRNSKGNYNDSFTGTDLGKLLSGAEAFDKELAGKIKAVLAANRALDSYIIGKFKEVESKD